MIMRQNQIFYHMLIRVYAKTKKKKTLEESEILPICSKKRVCEKIVLEEFSKFKYCKFDLKLFHDST